MHILAVHRVVPGILSGKVRLTDIRGETRVLLADPEITVEQVAARLKVSASTLYRHLPGGRGAVQDAAGTGK